MSDSFFRRAARPIYRKVRATSRAAAELAALPGEWGRYGRALRGEPGPAEGGADPLHLALFAWLFPPRVGGGVYRPSALVRYARASGYRVTVFCGPQPSAPSEAGRRLVEYVGPKVAVHSAADRRAPLSFLPRIDGGMSNAVDLYFRAKEALASDPPGVVVATGPPFHSFVAAHWVARDLGSRLVLDYRDEWTWCPFRFVSHGRADRRWERRCLESASRVIFTTASQMAFHRERYGELVAGKGEVVPNGWEPRWGAAFRAPPGRKDRITLVFAGKLGGHADPTRFLATVERLIDEEPSLGDVLRLRFIGLKTEAAEAQLARFPHAGVVENVPLVPAEDAAARMADADGLLLLHDERFARYLPGKLYEYVASGTPVLVLDDSGESRRVVTELGAGWALSAGDGKGLREILARLREGRPPAANPLRDQWLERHRREVVTRRFLRIIGEALSGPGTAALPS